MKLCSDGQSHVEAVLECLANVQPAGNDRWRATCPAHGSGRNLALSIALKDGKLFLHCFAGCDSKAVLAALGLTWRDLYLHSSKEYRPWVTTGNYRSAVPEQPVSENITRWKQWWKHATPAHPLLKAYIEARGLSVEPPSSLRLALWGEQAVMLARVEDPQGFAGMHLTLLKPDGSGRLEKRLAKGSHPLGGAIRLFPLEPDQPLALAEGIETALAVHQATGWPVWACVSAGGLAAVELPAGAREVVICADHDKAGIEAANALARRLLSEGRKVRLAVPPKAGEDWLDAAAQEVA